MKKGNPIGGWRLKATGSDHQPENHHPRKPPTVSEAANNKAPKMATRHTAGGKSYDGGVHGGKGC